MSQPSQFDDNALLQDRFRIEHKIGEGGMGTVYLVYDEHIKARRALKRILQPTPQLQAAFEREATLLANLTHEALPKVFDFFIQGDAGCIVMEYVAGDDLAQTVAQRGALPLNDVLGWADQLLSVLAYLHRHDPPILHRDIKPANIKINDRQRVVLLDFGIAKVSVVVNVNAEAQPSSVPAWTPHYAAPEQFLQTGTDARSDLYSVAATLSFLLSAQLPAPVNERIAALHTGNPDPLVALHTVNSQIPVQLSSLLRRMLSLRADERLDSADEFRQALQSFRQDVRPVAPRPVATKFAQSRATWTPPTEGGASPPRQRSAPHRSAAAPRANQRSLHKRIAALAEQVFKRSPNAWMVWCDPHGEWTPLLESVATDTHAGFELAVFPHDEVIGAAIGGLLARQRLQQYIDGGQSFVALVQAMPDQLGWLWAQALQAETIYSTSLREQLLQWGWRPQHSQVSDEEVAQLARQDIQHDPVAWSGGGLQPDLALLLDVLAGGARPQPEQSYLLGLTIEQTGLPSYDAESPNSWRGKSLARLLVTQAHSLAPNLVSERHEQLIAEGQRTLALELLTRWSDSQRLSKHLADAVLEADRLTNLGELFAEAVPKNGPLLSRAAEQAIFTATCVKLGRKTGKDFLQQLVRLEPLLTEHAEGFWSHPESRLDPSLAIPWDELARLSRAAVLLLTAAPEQEWDTVATAVRWYTTTGWQMDVAGEEILRGVSRSTPELLQVVSVLRDAYRTRWERTLLQWSDVWIGSGCPNPALPTAGDWLLPQLNSARPTAILMLDSLRYDLGSTLSALINTQEQTSRATVFAARSPLPSITALGMGLALPIREAQTIATIVDGEWQLLDTESQINLSRADQRRTWLQERGIVNQRAIFTVDSALHEDLPVPQPRSRLLITDSTIDQLGHDDEIARTGTSAILGRYRDVVIRLRDHGWRRILIVTDHGYIHWASNKEDRLTPPVAGAIYKSRRALAYPLETILPTASTLAPGGRVRVLPARSASSWSAYGGLGYFHGGASLQEWIIPCLAVEWPQSGQPVNISLQPIPRILSARPRVVLQVDRPSLLVEDSLPRWILVVVRHATEHTVIFRSEQVEVTPAEETVSVSLRLTPGAAASWDAPLVIDVRDALTEDVIASTTSTLRVRLDEWE